jgi:uncharacterized membrane protein YfcA
MPGGRNLKLALTGTGAGMFSGLFGVGGGSILVPLLVLWLGFDERSAAGTSLAAIVVIAAMAALLQGVAGNVNLLDGLLVGGPALVGVLAGTWLQQRIPTDVLGALLAIVMLVVAVDLVLT